MYCSGAGSSGAYAKCAKQEASALAGQGRLSRPCRVVVVDLTESYVRAGRWLTERLSLADRVAHILGPHHKPNQLANHLRPDRLTDHRHRHAAAQRRVVGLV